MISNEYLQFKLSAHKMIKSDIQKVSVDQHIQGHEGISSLLRSSGTCRRLDTNLTVEMRFGTGKKV